MLRLFNTLTRSIEPFSPADPARVTFYTCGLTVYDDGHIGNFRSFLAADVLRRFIESPLCRIIDHAGRETPGPREVVHVMNVTDVGHMTDDNNADGGGEDKMAIAGQRIAEAKKAGRLPPGTDIDPKDPRAIARFFTQRFIEDATQLGLKVIIEAATDPTLMPRASDNIEGMIRLAAALIERGHAYVAGKPGSRAVYFDVQSFPTYGHLSGNTLDALRGGAGGRVMAEHQAEKKHPADFLLWKEDESHIMKWPSPWGTGYPGWHIECSVMALDRLWPGGLVAALAAHASTPIEIDLHSGGEDNIFPHHECERAQTCAAVGGERFSKSWFHPRFLLVEGEKMSKSKGNFFTARDLFAQGHEPAAVRLELIKTHYRTNANFSMQGLRDAARMVERWRRFRDTARSNPASEGNATARATARDAFAAALENDLNTPEAIGAINQWIGAVESPVQADAELFDVFDAVLAVLDRPRLERASSGNIIFLPGVQPDDAIAALVEERTAAKKAKDFARADAIRNELAARGLAIKDVAGGKVEVGLA